jgi:hypothetical protein
VARGKDYAFYLDDNTNSHLENKSPKKYVEGGMSNSFQSKTSFKMMSAETPRRTRSRLSSKKKLDIRQNSLKRSSPVKSPSMTQHHGKSYTEMHNAEEMNQDTRIRNITVTKIYSSKKKKNRDKQKDLTRSPSKLNVVRVVTSSNKNPAYHDSFSPYKNEGRNNDIQQQIALENSSTINNGYVSSNRDNIEDVPAGQKNYGPKLSLHDSRLMPSLIRNDTETDTLSFLHSPTADSKTRAASVTSQDDDGDKENLQSESELEKTFYEGIYFLGDQADKILSYAFFNDNNVITKDRVSEMYEPTRSEF